VARLAADAGEAAGLDAGSVRQLHRAGLVHDLGRVSVSNAIWDKPGRLTHAEWERVRLHPHYSERVLCATPLLAPLGRLVGLHHERLDGTGYHRGVGGPLLPPAARILGAADAYQALGQERPFRPASTAPEATRELRPAVAAGSLDGDAAGAVLVAAGQRPARIRRTWPRGLTDREVEVLRLVARGRTARQIATELVISVPTANHHIEHVYGKVGVSSRAGAALFAVEHGLLDA
jgi:HD-GYP domain-containing protein (c-di-GMP phosphodiesterase class II)